MLLLAVMTTMTAWAGNIASRLEVCEGELNVIHVKGYAYNVNQQSTSLRVYVDIYSDEACTSQYGESHSLKANVSRPDLNDRGINGDHGFEAEIPIADAGIYYVKVYVQPSVLDDAEQINAPYSQVTATGLGLVTLSGSESYTAQDGDILTGSTSGTVTIADGASITLRYVTINGGIVCDGTATITLVGTNSVKGPQFKAGIQVGGAGTTLTIRGDGALTATGGDWAAGIGLSYAQEVDATGGDIVIENGTITANGGGDGAGIGTGVVGTQQNNVTASLGNITIKGGTVTANGAGHENALGIGTGFIQTNSHASFGAVTIYDNINYVDISKIWKTITYMHGDTDVTTFARLYFNIVTDGSRRIISPKSNEDYKDYAITIADGIENGSLAGPMTAKFREEVTMTVTPDQGYALLRLIITDSQGNYYMVEGSSFIMPQSDVTVSAVFVISNHYFVLAGSESYTAQDGDALAGSTSGRLTIADGASITLCDATIKGGIICDGTATITLVGTNSVKGPQYKAGIQVGGAGTTLTIRGDGALTATGGSRAAGIGLSCAEEVDATGGDIVIESGTITANGGYCGAGIGTGVVGTQQNNVTASLGNITIKGGTVTANGAGHENALGIGTGFIQTNSHASFGAVTIYDNINYVDISKILTTITYMHGDTDVTDSASDYFFFAADGSRRLISSKNGKDYVITIADDIEHGSVAGPSTAKYLERVTMTVTPDEGYGFRQLIVKDSQGNDVAANFTSFMMPRYNVTVSAEFSNSDFFINIADGIEHGTITGPTNADYGDQVTMTITPNEGYTFLRLIVKDSQNHDVAAEGTSFTMPLSSVTVSAEFYHNYDVNLNNYGNYTAWDGDALTGSTSGTVTIAAGASITLHNATIGSGVVCNGSATITLVGTNNVTVPASTNMAGIRVGPEGTTLTIRGDGSLTVKGGSCSAGIGLSACYYNTTGGDIVIEGGTITATGGPYDPLMPDQYLFGAGIGLGEVKDGYDKVTVRIGDITIKGGTVTAIADVLYSDGIGKGKVQTAYATIQLGKVTVYDEAVMVDATSISQAVTYMHGDTDVTANPGEYFTITHNANRFLIMPKGISEEPVTIVDGTPFTQVRDHIVPSASYTKTLGSERVGKHQAWLVPFDYTITAADEEKFSFYKINMIANSPSPSQAASNEMWVFLTRLNAGDVLHANMPYVYKPLEAVTDYAFTTALTTLKAKNTDVLAKTETMEDIYSFYGTYENTTPAASDLFYYVGIDGNVSLGNNGAVTVGPYRWIIRKTNKFGNTPSYVRQMHFFDGESDDVDGIVEVQGSRFKVQAGAPWYDLQGRKIGDSPSVTRHSSLPKGIYIHNGKKVVIK